MAVGVGWWLYCWCFDVGVVVSVCREIEVEGGEDEVEMREI